MISCYLSETLYYEATASESLLVYLNICSLWLDKIFPLKLIVRFFVTHIQYAWVPQMCMSTLVLSCSEKDNILMIVNLSVVWYSYIVNCVFYCLYILYQTLWRVLQCQRAKFPRRGVDKSLKCCWQVPRFCGLKVCVNQSRPQW